MDPANHPPESQADVRCKSDRVGLLSRSIEGVAPAEVGTKHKNDFMFHELRKVLKIAFSLSGLVGWAKRRGKTVRVTRLKSLDQRILRFLTDKTPMRSKVLQLKSLSHYFRKCGVEDLQLKRARTGLILPCWAHNRLNRMCPRTRRICLFQLSRIGRSLPEGDFLIVRKSLRKYVSTTGTDWIVPQTTLDIIRIGVVDLFPNKNTDPLLDSPYLPQRRKINVSNLVARLKVRYPDEQPLQLEYGCRGASYDTPRHKGGFRSDIDNQVRQHVVKRDAVPHDSLLLFRPVQKFEEHSLDAQPMFQFGMRSVYVRTEKKWEWDYNRVSKLLVIRERGFKARVLTVSDARLVFDASCLRKFFQKRLEKIPEIAHGQGPSDRIRVPYRRARIPYQRERYLYSADISNATDGVSREVLDIILEWCCIPSDYVYLPRVEIGEYNHYTVRGTFMGLPLSFVVLTIYHFLIADYVNRTHGGKFVIRGDDLLAWWMPEQYALYTHLLHSVGSSVNDDKTFKNEKFGVFCERLYEFRSGDFVRVPTVSIRGITNTGLDTIKFNPDVFRAITDKHSLKMIYWNIPKWYRFIAPFPVNVGGFGLPPLRKHLTPTELGIYFTIISGHSIPILESPYDDSVQSRYKRDKYTFGYVPSYGHTDYVIDSLMAKAKYYVFERPVNQKEMKQLDEDRRYRRYYARVSNFVRRSRRRRTYFRLEWDKVLYDLSHYGWYMDTTVAWGQMIN